MLNKLIKMIELQILTNIFLFVTGIAGNWTKLKTQEFLINGPEVSSIYFDFLSGPFYHSVKKQYQYKTKHH